MNSGERKVALVPNGCEGFGPAICQSLAERGWTLAIQHAAAGSKVLAGQHYFCHDLATTADCEALVSEVRASLGSISLLVNLFAEGAGSEKDILSATADEFPVAVTAPIKAAFFLTQQMAREMISSGDAAPSGSPRILNVYQSEAYAPTMQAAGRRMTSAGVRMLTKLWALRLRESGIGVFAVRVPVGDELKHADDVAAMVAALAGGSVPAATGQVLAVGDGGDIPQL